MSNDAPIKVLPPAIRIALSTTALFNDMEWKKVQLHSLYLPFLKKTVTMAILTHSCICFAILSKHRICCWIHMKAFQGSHF